MELLERKTVLETLGQLMLDATTGHGRLVFLGAEAGVGKTALLERFCESQQSGARTFTGACDPLAIPRPLGPLMDMARQLGGWRTMLKRQGTQRQWFSTRHLLPRTPHRCELTGKRRGSMPARCDSGGDWPSRPEPHTSRAGRTSAI